jgi:tetratricopeptide (TPR) repeat protein
MRKKAVPLLLLLIFAGCAYFNTFYNAKQFYKKAYHETKKNLTSKPSSTENNYYQEAIDRSLTLIVKYPNSKYVDDALLLAGKSYYYRQEYFQAKRKFLELMSNYPDGPFVDEAKLWMARTQFALDEFEEAQTLVDELVSQDVLKSIKGQAYYYLGKFHERNRNFKDAVTAYQNALQYGVGDLKVNTLYSLGTSLDTLGHYQEARDAFEKVPKSTRLTEFIFEGYFRSAQMDKKLGNTKEALKEFQTLMADENYTRHIPDIRVQIADAYYRSGDADAAIEYYAEITQLHEKTMQAAEAFYRMGIIFEKYYRDYEQALENYLLVKQTNSRSEYADTAEVYARDIQRLQALIEVVKMGKMGKTGETVLMETQELEEDTLTLELAYDMMDTTRGDSACYALLRELGGKIFADSVFLEKNKTLDERQREIDLNMGQEEELRIDWRKWVEEGEIPSYSDFEPEFARLQKLKKMREKPEMADNPLLSSFRVEELDRNLFLLAEMYNFRFESPDSAFNSYDQLVRQFPESSYAPKALFNIANLYKTHYDNPDQEMQVYQTLVREYGDTVYGNAARERLDLDPVRTRSDSIQYQFKEAESLLLDEKHPRQALQLYQQIWQGCGGSEYEPKAMYAVGYVYEHYLDSLKRAEIIYDSLVSWFPDTRFAALVQPKIKAIQEGVEKPDSAEQNLTPDNADSTAATSPADSLGGPQIVLSDSAATVSGSSELKPTPKVLRRDSSEQTIRIHLDLMARKRRENRRLQMEHTR